MREMIHNWEPSARSVLAEFRAATGLYVHEPWFTTLVRELGQNSTDFRRWWQQHEIEKHHVTTREVEHPFVGRMVLEESVLVVDDRSGRMDHSRDSATRHRHREKADGAFLAVPPSARSVATRASKAGLRGAMEQPLLNSIAPDDQIAQR